NHLCEAGLPVRTARERRVFRHRAAIAFQNSGSGAVGGDRVHARTLISGLYCQTLASGCRSTCARVNNWLGVTPALSTESACISVCTYLKGVPSPSERIDEMAKKATKSRAAKPAKRAVAKKSAAKKPAAR